MVKDWYGMKIEKPIRNLVKLLRDNGFNTICSCGHTPKPYVQMESSSEYDINKLYNLLVENGFKNFTIHFCWTNIDDGKLHEHRRTLEVSFFVSHSLIKESDIRDIK